MHVHVAVALQNLSLKVTGLSVSEGFLPGDVYELFRSKFTAFSTYSYNSKLNTKEIQIVFEYSIQNCYNSFRFSE